MFGAGDALPVALAGALGPKAAPTVAAATLEMNVRRLMLERSIGAIFSAFAKS